MDDLSDQFVTQLKQWVELDNKIKEKQQAIADMRKQKDKMEAKLVPYMKQQNLAKSAFNFQQQKIYLGKDTTYSSLSYSFIDSLISESMSLLSLNIPFFTSGLFLSI